MMNNKYLVKKKLTNSNKKDLLKHCGTAGYSEFNGIDNDWKEKFDKNIEKQYIYPKNFNITYFNKENKISIDCDCGIEFFHKANFNVANFIGYILLVVYISPWICFYLLNASLSDIFKVLEPVASISFYLFCLILGFYLAQYKSKNKIHFNINENGLNIEVQKKSFFIERENIASIGSKEFNGSYQIYLTCCKPVNIQNKKEKQVFNLFDKYSFKEDTAEFIVKKVRNIWKFDSSWDLVEIK